MEKPTKLYRGLHLNFDDFEKFNLGGDLISPYDPVIDEHGRQKLRSGNEYGVYMTTNKQMALDIYGNVHNGGICINDHILIGTHCEKLIIPAVGIVYEIDSTNLNIRKPWISKEFESSYNSNYDGDEFITDVIPFTNCRIIRILIGRDLLHDQEQIEVSGDLAKLKEHILRILKTRKWHLSLLEQELLQHPSNYVRHLMPIDLDMYKELFGYGGIKYMDTQALNNIDIMRGDGIIKYLLGTYYRQDPQNYRTLKYICSLKNEILEENKLEALVDLLFMKLSKTEQNRRQFIERKRENGEEVNTRGFDQTIELCKDILAKIKVRTMETSKGVIDDARKTFK